MEARLTPSARLVYNRVKDYDRRARSCGQITKEGCGIMWPSQERLAQEAGVSLRSAVAALRTLEQAGYIKRKRRGRGHSNIMHIAPQGWLFDSTTGQLMQTTRPEQITRAGDHQPGQQPAPDGPRGAAAGPENRQEPQALANHQPQQEAARTAMEAREPERITASTARKEAQEPPRTVEEQTATRAAGEAQAAPEKPAALTIQAIQAAMMQHAQEAPEEAPENEARQAELAYLDTQNLRIDNNKGYINHSPVQSIYPSRARRKDRQTRKEQIKAEKEERAAQEAAQEQERARAEGWLIGTLKSNYTKEHGQYGNQTREQLERNAHIDHVDHIENPRTYAVYLLMLDMITRPQRISGRTITPGEARAAIANLTWFDIDMALERISSSTMFTEVHNRRAYMMQTILNAAHEVKREWNPMDCMLPAIDEAAPDIQHLREIINQARAQLLA